MLFNSNVTPSACSDQAHFLHTAQSKGRYTFLIKAPLAPTCSVFLKHPGSQNHTFYLPFPLSFPFLSVLHTCKPTCIQLAIGLDEHRSLGIHYRQLPIRGRQFSPHSFPPVPHRSRLGGVIRSVARADLLPAGRSLRSHITR